MAGKTILEEGKPQEFICPVKEVQLRSKNSIMEFGHTPLKSPSDILSLLSRTRDIFESLGIRLIPDSDSESIFFGQSRPATGHGLVTRFLALSASKSGHL